MRPVKIISVCLLLAVLSCKPETEVIQINKEQVGFLSFSSNGQTLPTAFDELNQEIRFEVDHDVDVTELTPTFEVPAGYSVFSNGKQQNSGITKLDFSQPVSYEIRNSQNEIAAIWNVRAIPLSCKILVDASHDGGVWWFPQSYQTGYDQDEWHQGKAFADILREKGFEVDELGKDAQLTEEMFFGYYIVIRAMGFEPYTTKELEVYSKIAARGMNLVFFTDHKKYDPVDELGDLLGIRFEGIANGTISSFATHDITNNLTSIDYIAGSVLTNADQNENIEILGWLSETDYGDLNMNDVKDPGEVYGPPVMGILHYPNSKVFFIGDGNGLQVMPQPFIDNLINWMGTCFVP